MSVMIKTTLAVAMISALAGCGSSDNSSAPAQASPTAAISANFASVTQSGKKFNAPVGGLVTLSGLASTDSGSTITAYRWELTSKPATSTRKLAHATSATATFTPDVAGDYVVTLKVTDAAGISSSEKITISASAAIPVINITKTVQFNGPSTTEPTQNISSGNLVTLDASASTDPNGQPLTIDWLILQKPSGSATSLTINNKIANFAPDALGIYQVRARATNSDGASADVIYVFNVNALAPNTVVHANATPISGSGSVNAATNYNVVLDSSSSTVASGDNSTTTWTLTSKPVGSSISLSALSGSQVNFVPDIAGDYVVTSTVTDSSNGTANSYVMTVHVAQAPTAVVTGSATPVALASGPSFVSSAGVPVVLRGSSSFGSTPNTLSYAWTLVSKPSFSNAPSVLPTTANINFTPDVDGQYVAQLVVTDITGLSSSQNLTINVGGHPPIVVLAQSQGAVVLGKSYTDSAVNSYSPDGSPLSFSWSIDARPAGSVATIAAPTASTLNFTPDVAGSYTASVTVTSGSFSAVAQVQISAVTATSGTLPLTYAPLISKYSKSLDKAIIISANPNALHIVDPVADTDVSVALPSSVKDLSISPDGTKAAVLHEGVVSLIDLTTASLIHSSATGGSQTSVFLDNASQVYLVGQTGGQWVTPSYKLLNATTGALIQNSNLGNNYGTTLGAFADTKNKLFVVSLGLSPQDIQVANLAAGTGLVTSTAYSPYHGTYTTGAPLWVSADQNLLFTSSGTYFKTSDLTYQGTLGLTGKMLSFTNSSSAHEFDALQDGNTSFFSQTPIYPNVYKRYTGSLLQPAADAHLPLVANQQAYGINIFYASNDKHVVVVQTGDSAANASGLQYYVIVR